MNQTALMAAAAYILDLIFGDPGWLPHPVKGIGYLAQKLEIFSRKAIRNERAAGIIFAAVIIGAVYAVSFIIILAASHYNRYLGFALSVLFIYTTLSIKDLKTESMRVYWALKNGQRDAARKYLSLIVGRDTENLGDADIIRATVETVSENTVDGIIAPIFYAFLGGAPLALAYKAASTLDSMVGYKNDKYKDFGWASAKIDDILNFVPARLSAFIMPLASWLAGLDAVNSFKVTLRDRKNNPSPNSGIPEAAVAGALSVRLGGLNYYNSVAVMKQFMGDDKNVLAISHIKESLRIAYISALLAVVLGISAIYILHKIG